LTDSTDQIDQIDQIGQIRLIGQRSPPLSTVNCQLPLTSPAPSPYSGSGSSGNQRSSFTPANSEPN